MLLSIRYPLTREGRSGTFVKHAYDVARGRRDRRRINNDIWRKIMAWTVPTIVEVCAGFEVTAYATAEV